MYITKVKLSDVDLAQRDTILALVSYVTNATKLVRPLRQSRVVGNSSVMMGSGRLLNNLLWWAATPLSEATQEFTLSK